MRTAVLLALLLVSPTSRALAQAAPLDAVAADRIRIGAHLARVEADLRAAPVDHLTASQRAARGERLDDLRAYRLRLELPHGHAAQPGARVPTFIDRDGRACAMGQLVIDSGHRDVAEAIARDQNHARVPEITHPALGPWLAANGMTLAEAARVQPAYCFEECGDAGASQAVCGSDGRPYLCAAVARCEGIAVVGAASCDGAVCTCGADPSDAGVPVLDAGGATVAPRGGCSAGRGTGAGGASLILALVGLALILRRR